MKATNLILMAAWLLLTACSDDRDTQAPPSKTAGNEKSIGRQQSVTTESPIPRKQDSSKVVLGRKLFAQNCASCHGTRAEGGPLWSKTGPLPKDPSPPLNGTGHTWYHPVAVLKRIIMHGSAQLGSGMPAWGDKLSDKDMEAIITWFQSLWSDKKYATWAQLDAEVRRNQVTP